ncbi:SulP family inorganic anion transporter [Eoetvoesiella caeni]|uniref:SulP family sulfate permease n=1 Tax=Eoetvoesiella caeni TaxID=645616 RepID=A0A366HM91_9BURK|nr:SulP family inorganic anion transporter [Eoetvoesiella caeni]MCI2807256.1 SulP family inorganic anion transporter [Eoetvoesiella caeni]NYT53348.1 STAS domain-containing protein [Eoetvoesiella caeni]RBP43331.1 SulP family sulfate permease [Eoetvoesiella caeni]
MFVFLEAYRAGLLNRNNWTRNIVAGVIVGVVALPLAMAFAIASGVKPEQGLYTAIIAGLAVSVFGGSRVQIAGPTGAFIVILSDIVVRHGVDGLQVATFMAGIILVLFGLSRLGAVIKFIPRPVIIGFTAGIGVIIWVGQWKDFFGLPPVSGEYFHQKLWHLLQVLPQWHLNTTALALLSLLLVVFSSRLPRMRHVPGPLLALVVATALQSIFHFDGVATIGSTFGEIPRGLPHFQWPDVSLGRVVELVGPAFAIAMLGAIESLLSAVVADGMAGTRHNSNQELVGQGLANIAAPLFGGIAATGAIARTATNIRNGGNSPLAGIVHSLTLVLIILFLAPYAANVPLAVLAAILFVVAWNMSEARHFVRMVRRAPRADVVILLVTFGLTVFADLVVAVNIGVVLAMLFFLRRMAGSVEVNRQSDASLRKEFAYLGFEGLPDAVQVYSVEGPLFYGAVEAFQQALSESGPSPRVLVIRLRHVPFIDATGLQVLEEAVEDLQRRRVRVMLAEVNGRVYRKLGRIGLVDKLGRKNIGQSLIAILERAAETAGDDGGNN